MNATELRHAINLADGAVFAHLKTRPKMISTTEEIAQVGTISVSGEREIGDLIDPALEKVGKEAVIAVSMIAMLEDGKNLYSELEVVEAMKLDQIPAYIVAQNAGVEGTVLVGKLLEQHSLQIGYDEARGEYVNMVNADIIDPVITELPNDDSPAFPYR